MKYLNGVAVCCLGSILFLSCQEQFEEDSERQEGQQLPMSVIAQIGVIHNEPTPRYSGEVGSAIFAEGDKIGMFVDDNPVTEWTYSLKWTSPKAYWDDLVTEVHSLPFIHIMMRLLIEQSMSAIFEGTGW